MKTIFMAKHLVETIYDIEILEDIVAPIPEIMREHVGFDNEIIKAGAKAKLAISASTQSCCSATLHYGENFKCRLPMGPKPGDKMKFAFKEPDAKQNGFPLDRDGECHGPSGNNPRHPLDMD